MSHLSIHGISKSFGTVQALSEVSAEFSPGKIHAILGENGAGKSTLVNILAGFIRPDAGQILLSGQPLPLGNPIKCRKAGIAMVHQHFMLVPQFTVVENLALSQMDNLKGSLRVDELAENALKVGRQLGWHVNPDAVTSDLPVGVQQRIEILKVLAKDSPVLILDEPTAVLSSDEVEDLFRVLGNLRQQGKTILLIAHKLAEVMRVADDVIVLSHGKKVAESAILDTNVSQLAEWMIGELPERLQETRAVGATVSLQMENVVARGDRGEVALEDLSLTVKEGEILGIGGVDGNGQVELAEVAAGIRRIEKGSVTREGNSVAYIPQDRQTDGLVLSMSIRDNMLLDGYRRSEFGWGPFMKVGKVDAWAQDLMQRFDVRAEGPDTIVGTLSGGNQQKVVASRTLDKHPDLLVAVNPTRGLDVRAADFVHSRILQARAERTAVLLISTDMDELAALADRTLFLSRGKLHEALTATSVVGEQ